MRYSFHRQDASVSQGPSTPHDERAPLLAKIDSKTPQDSTHDDPVLAKSSHDEPDRSKLLWAMASGWLGTFCAGLGEH